MSGSGAVLDELYVNRDGVYAITALKHEPKDFSLKELKQEIARSRSLAGLYQTARNLLRETLDGIDLAKIVDLVEAFNRDPK